MQIKSSTCWNYYKRDGNLWYLKLNVLKTLLLFFTKLSCVAVLTEITNTKQLKNRNSGK